MEALDVDSAGDEHERCKNWQQMAGQHWGRQLLRATAGLALGTLVLLGVLHVTTGQHRLRSNTVATEQSEALFTIGMEQWRQEPNCYCGRDRKIGRTIRGAGASKCQSLCLEEPLCVAYEMYKGGSDCTLRPKCPYPRPSSKGTLLVIHAERITGTEFPDDMPCIGVPDPTTITNTTTIASVTPRFTTKARGGIDVKPPTPVPPLQPTPPAPGPLPGPVTMPPFPPIPTAPSPTLASRVPAGPTTTTAPCKMPCNLYSPLEKDGPLPLPLPWGGTQVVETTTCAQALQLIVSQACEPEVLKQSAKRTCTSSRDTSQDSCRAWFAGVDKLSESDAQTEVKKCSTASAALLKESAQKHMVQPTTQEEERLCFACRITCVVPGNESKLAQEVMGFAPPEPAQSGVTSGDLWEPDGSEKHCRPMKHGKVEDGALQKRRRREVHLWSEQDWDRFKAAMERLKEGGKYAEFAKSFPQSQPGDSRDLARIQALPWLRQYLLAFETELQKVAQDCELTLPFWNPSLEASPESRAASKVWASNRLGGRPKCPVGKATCDTPTVTYGTKCTSTPGGWCLGDGLANGWKVEGEDPGHCQCVSRSPTLNSSLASYPVLLGTLFRHKDYANFSDAMDAFSIDVRCGMLGTSSTMCTEKVAAWDPLFLLHQANIDMLFLMWQRHRVEDEGVDPSVFYGTHQLMSLYGEALEEMFGTYDPAQGCVMLPKSEPHICLSYDDTYDASLW